MAQLVQKSVGRKINDGDNLLDGDIRKASEKFVKTIAGSQVVEKRLDGDCAFLETRVLRSAGRD